MNRLLVGAILFSSSLTSAGVELRLARETSTQVRLDWTGEQVPFSIYRSTVPGGIVAPSNLVANVSGTTWTDTAAFGALLFYYVEVASCSTNAECQDTTLCNGVESCVGGSCQPGVPPNCNDGITCTADACNPATGCTHVPNDALCPCGQTCDLALGCSSTCIERSCDGSVYQCGDCLDNDGDCRVDADDDQCLGACDNTEQSLHAGLPGINPSCTQDCFFDDDTGSGNDGCTWSHRCDPLEVAPNFPPGGSGCSYIPTTTVGGRTCSQMMGSQSSTCTEFCGVLTPNGCDAFGCCSIPGAPGPVWLGSLDAGGSGSCTLADLNDPSRCKPCTPVTSGVNTCAHCELCVGKTTLPGDCTVQTCPAGAAPCGLTGQAACASGSYCISGCCQPLP